jgi:hypothetical protein
VGKVSAPPSGNEPATPPARRGERKRSRQAGRGWAQQIETGATALTIRLEMVLYRPPPSGVSDGERHAICEGAQQLIEGARSAARGVDPYYRWPVSWWRGANIEAAFRKSHQAEAELIRLYTDEEASAEATAAVARANAALNRDDPMRVAARSLLRSPAAAAPAAAAARRLLLSKTVQVGHEAVDGAHSRLRNLRNVLLSTTACITVLVLIFVIVVARNPTIVPFCFDPQGADGVVACPTGDGPDQVPHGLDVVVVAMLGLLGGSLAAALSIRNLRGTQTPYDIPIALAWLKVPVGALTAIGTLIAIRGAFVPGLSALDSQEQVLAYALIFGYAQQLLTGLIDRHALQVLASVPSKDPEQDQPLPPVEPPSVQGTSPPVRSEITAAAQSSAGSTGIASSRTETGQEPVPAHALRESQDHTPVTEQTTRRGET